jgi:hypothetical protein
MVDQWHGCWENNMLKFRSDTCSPLLICQCERSKETPLPVTCDWPYVMNIQYIDTVMILANEIACSMQSSLIAHCSIAITIFIGWYIGTLACE